MYRGQSQLERPNDLDSAARAWPCRVGLIDMSGFKGGRWSATNRQGAARSLTKVKKNQPNRSDESFRIAW